MVQQLTPYKSKEGISIQLQITLRHYWAQTEIGWLQILTDARLWESVVRVSMGKKQADGDACAKWKRSVNLGFWLEPLSIVEGARAQ